MKNLLALIVVALACSNFANHVFAQQPPNGSNEPARLANQQALRPDDKRLIEAIRNNLTESFFAAMDPELLKFLNRDEIERRLSTLSQKASPFDLSTPISVSPHPQLGFAQTEIVFQGKTNEEPSKVAFTIGRDRNEKLIGIEVVCHDWSLSTMDTVNDSSQLSRKMQSIFEPIFKGEIEKSVAAMPGDEGVKSNGKQFAGAMFQAIQGQQYLEWEDIDITLMMPAENSGKVRIAAYGQAETDQAFFVCESRFAIDKGEFSIVELNMGESVMVNHFSQNTSPAEKYAKAVASGNIKQFAKLFAEHIEPEVAKDRTVEIMLQETIAMAGKLVGIRPETLSGRYRFADKVMTYSCEFVAEFENADIKMSMGSRFGEAYSFNVVTSHWLETDSVRDYLQPIAKNALNTYLNESAEAMKALLNQYPGEYDQLTQDRIDTVQKNTRLALGDIVSIDSATPVYENGVWTFRYRIKGSDSDFVGEFKYGQRSLSFVLVNFSVGPANDSTEQK